MTRAARAGPGLLAVWPGGALTTAARAPWQQRDSGVRRRWPRPFGCSARRQWRGAMALAALALQRVGSGAARRRQRRDGATHRQWRDPTTQGKAGNGPQKAPFGQHFFGRTQIACSALFLHFDRKIYLFFLVSLPFFLGNLLLPLFWGRYALFYHESLCDIPFSCCLHLKAHLLHIFRMSVEHFPNFLRIFFFILK